MSPNKTPILIIVAIFFWVFWSGCAHDRCNNLPQRPLASENLSPSPSPQPTISPIEETKPASPTGPTVEVFKPTGEKQCETGSGTTLEIVKNQLAVKKILVIGAHTQADGLMHMALCGAPTGTIHVFTIPKSLESKALKLGFKIFKAH